MLLMSLVGPVLLWDPGTLDNGMCHTKIPPQGHVAYTLPPVTSNPAWPFVLRDLSCALHMGMTSFCPLGANSKCPWW